MSDKTKIEWADATWNPVTGCTPVSPGCEKCYAARMVRRFPHLHGISGQGVAWDPIDVEPISFSNLQFHHDRLDAPLHWKQPRRIFVCSMGDLFHNGVSFEWIFSIMEIIRKTPQHTYLILTKRPQRMEEYFNEFFLGEYHKNIWLGVTAENQEMADKRIPLLLQIPAAKRFVSVEPMLNEINLANYLPHYPNGRCGHTKLDQVIVGPETGPGARPMNLDWARSLRDQCVAAGVPLFYKRGELDGKLWHEFPVSK
jgi:protein gp37